MSRSAHSLLPMPLLTGQQHAEAEYVEQHGVKHGPLGERVLENGAEPRWRIGVTVAVCSSGTPVRSASRRIRVAASKAASDEDAREVMAERSLQGAQPDASAVEALEKPDLALAENEHAARRRYSSKPASASPVF
jgi:hypothetical protein